MKAIILKFLTPLLLCGAVFTGLHIYRDGWSSSTSAGADIWGLLFYGLGTAAVPFLVALVVAATAALIRRSVNFLNVWLTTFLIASAIFSISFYTVAHYQRANAQGQPLGIKGCPVSGLFSANATTTPIDIPDPYRGKAWRTIDVYADGFSSLDCYLVSPAEMLPNMSHIDILLAWANQEGLEQEGIWAVDSPHPHSKMRSKKTIDGREVILEHRIFLFEQAFALVTSAADQASFPTEQNQAFLASIALTGDSP